MYLPLVLIKQSDLNSTQKSKTKPPFFPSTIFLDTRSCTIFADSIPQSTSQEFSRSPFSPSSPQSAESSATPSLYAETEKVLQCYGSSSPSLLLSNSTSLSLLPLFRRCRRYSEVRRRGLEAVVARATWIWTGNPIS